MTTTNTDEYNGWTNRETWAVHLHITNDEWANDVVFVDISERLDRDREERAARHEILGWGGDPKPTMSDAGEAVRDFVDRWIDMFCDDSDARSIANILGDIGSLWRVNWEEVAAAILEGTHLLDQR